MSQKELENRQAADVPTIGSCSGNSTRREGVDNTSAYGARQTAHNTFLTALNNNIATVLNKEMIKSLNDIDRRLGKLQAQLLKRASSKADYEYVADEIYVSVK